MPNNAIAQSEFELILTNYEVAQSNVDMGEAAVQQCEAAKRIAEATLKHTVICSPIDSMIIDRRIDIGQTVVASSFNTPGLFLIAKDLHHMQVWASVKESDIDRIRQGTPVEFAVDAQPDKTLNGNVVYVRPNATRRERRNVHRDCQRQNSENLLPNQTANLQFEIEQHSVLLVPDDALSKPATLASEGCDADGMAANAAADGKAGPQTSFPHGRCAWAAHARKM